MAVYHLSIIQITPPWLDQSNNCQNIGILRGIHCQLHFTFTVMGGGTPTVISVKSRIFKENEMKHETKRETLHVGHKVPDSTVMVKYYELCISYCVSQYQYNYCGSTTCSTVHV